MKEIEILVEVKSSKEEALSALKSFQNKWEKHTLDMYYFDPMRKQLQKSEDAYPIERLRLRDKNGIAYITYKKDIFDDAWKRIYSNEFETKVEDFSTIKNILEVLWFTELVVVDNIKHTYESELYEIVLEEVQNLWLFLEVEKKRVEDNEDPVLVKQEIQRFINEDLWISVSSEVWLWKPELLMRKQP